MRHIFYLAAIAVLILINSPSAYAQSVIVAPGLIQAPFFRMEWLPGGGTHIQAPFVDLYTGSRCAPCRTPQVSDYSSAIEQPRPDAPLAQQLFVAGRELNRSLANFDTGNRWQNYLGLALGGPLSQIPVDRRPGVYLYPVSSKLDLGTLRTRFDTVNQDDRFSVITSLPAFQKTRQLLAAFLAERQNPSASSPEEIPPPVPTRPPASDRPQPLDL